MDRAGLHPCLTLYVMRKARKYLIKQIEFEYLEICGNLGYLFSKGVRRPPSGAIH